MRSPDLAPFSSLVADDGTHAKAYQALVERSAGCSTRDDRMLRAALAYGPFGWPAFPCDGKIPAIKGGRGCHDATTDRERISAMWRGYPGSNIGVATGERSGFWVLDVDPRHGGDASLAALERQHAPLPPTVEQITGSAGQHLLFRHDPAWPVRNRVGFRPGLDARGDGGYIVVAPSLHPETGRRYVWVPELHPMRMPLTAAPAWLLTLVAPSLVPPASAPQSPTIEDDRWGPAPRYSRRALERACETIASAPIGQQDATLIREAFSIGTLVAGGYMPALLAADALIWAGAQMTNDPHRRPWQPWEIREKVGRALARAAACPRSPRAAA